VEKVSSSFRDPSGYVYEEKGVFYRKVSPEYKPILDQLLDSALYSKLTSTGMLLPCRWVSEDTILPEQVPFISYPYEWSFSMLKDAALLTLEVQKMALEHDMILKDASAYNIQFVKGRPILIDHLSFYPYEEGKPWVAYGQFCSHFLAPLALASYKDISFIRQLQLDTGGLRLGVASRLLPFRAKLHPGILTHVSLHGVGSRAIAPKPWMKVSKLQLLSLIGSLESTIKNLKWEPIQGWKDYLTVSNYSSIASAHKTSIVRRLLRRTDAKVVADLGANLGYYSNIALESGARVVAIDSDPACVELCYKNRNGSTDLLPLVADLVNPSPSVGWENAERDSLVSRLKVDTVLALALVHHLAISHNLPLSRVAKFLSSMCRHLIVEFVPKKDSQVQTMLRFREDIFSDYNVESFEREFSKYFSLIDKENVEGSVRSIYLMEVI